MSRRAGIFAVAAAVLVLAGAPTAVAGGRNVRAATDVAIDLLSPTGELMVALGSVDSKKSRCVDNRKVRVTAVPENGPDFRFDVARTGGGGGWFAVHDLDEVEASAPFKAIVLRVAKRKLPLSHGRTLVCGGARERVTSL